MENIEKVNDIINKRLKLSLETLTVKDLLEIENLKENEEELSEYLDMPIIHFLSLLKLNRIYKNKKIDNETYNYLKHNLDEYYRLKKKIAEIEYTSYISDNLNIDNIIDNYVSLLSLNYKYLDRYGVLFDPVEDKISDIIVRGIDQEVRTNKRKTLKNK